MLSRTTISAYLFVKVGCVRSWRDDSTGAGVLRHTTGIQSTRTGLHHVTQGKQKLQTPHALFLLEKCAVMLIGVLIPDPSNDVAIDMLLQGFDLTGQRHNQLGDRTVYSVYVPKSCYLARSWGVLSVTPQH